MPCRSGRYLVTFRVLLFFGYKEFLDKGVWGAEKKFNTETGWVIDPAEKLVGLGCGCDGGAAIGK